MAVAVVKEICEMAAQPALNELSIVSNFKEEFELLKNRKEEIDCVLNEANEESAEQKESVKKWLHRVQDIVWEAEDLLQECDVDSIKIRKVKARMSPVFDEGNQLSIVRAAVRRKEDAESSSSSQGQRFKRSSLLPSDSKPVGIQSKIESILNLLENSQIPIIAVVGMRGMGKTYLLQHVYDALKGRYEKSAWLSVSQFYYVSKLQRDLASHLEKDLSDQIKEGGVSEQRAAELIHGFLLGKRYLIVLDDVWRASKEGDLIDRLGLPTRDNSEFKILVSTRSREVCTNFSAHVYEMEYLTDEESWSLFCAYAFSGCEGNRPPQHLEEVARNIVKKCGKLPLAIKTTAASLTSTTLPKDWDSKFNKLKKVDTSRDPVIDILKLSYDSLPAHVKDCFAYLSFFPEDEQINCEYLIYLWMVEGIIPAGENPWDCLDHLANLCLLEVWEDEYLEKYCKIHDLLLDLAILISRENKCAFRVEDAFSKSQSVNTGGGRWCRLFLSKKGIDENAISDRRPVSPTLVRTLSLSRNSQIGGNIPAKLFSGMKVLRVLDLSYTNISTLPACVGKMKLLKVLNLRETEIKEVPDCVRSLKSLSYLSVSSSGLVRIEAPKWISELRCLQHLEGTFERMPKGISKLESLRKLRSDGWLSLSMEEEEGVLRLEDVGKMSEIEEIWFKVEDESQLKRMEEGILAPLQKMHWLGVKNDIRGMQGEQESDLPQFPERMSAMRDLERLSLHNFAVPSWIFCLSNLRYLNLGDCDCSNYPELEAMPNLVSLWLWGNKRCRELPKAFGKSGGFPHLRLFSIWRFDELEEFPEMEDGAMACLEKLSLQLCKKVNKVGEGLERLRRLKEISLRDFGTDDLREMFKEGGIYWKKFKDINPQTTIYGID